MGARDDQLLLEKLKSLAQVAAHASEPAFKEVWDNPDDAEYDRL